MSFVEEKTPDDMVNQTKILLKRYEMLMMAIFVAVCEKNKIDHENDNLSQAIFQAVRIAFTSGYQTAKDEKSND